MPEKDDRIYVDADGRVIAGGAQVDGPEPRTPAERAARRAIINRQLGIGEDPPPPSSEAQEAAPPAFVVDEDDLERIKVLEEKYPDFYEIRQSMAEYATRLPEEEGERLARDTKAFLKEYRRRKQIRKEVEMETLEDSIKERNPDFPGIERQDSPRPVRQPAEPSKKEQAEYWKGRMHDPTLTPTQRGDAEIELIRVLFSEKKR